MTFPFLFAVMFGDWGHASLMLMFAGFMLYKEKDLMGKDLGDMVGMLFAGRCVGGGRMGRAWAISSVFLIISLDCAIRYSLLHHLQDPLSLPPI